MPTAKLYGMAASNQAMAVGTSEIGYVTFTAHRAGKITVSAYFGRQNSAAVTLAFCRLLLNGTEVSGTQAKAVSATDRIYLTASLTCDVSLNDTVVLNIYTSTAQTMDVRFGANYTA